MAHPPFTIRDIPAAMRLNGWNVGAAVMDRWFSRVGRGMTAEEKRGDAASPDIETGLVTMAWATGFSRVKDANDNLIATWHTGERRAPSIGVIEQRLRRWRATRAGPPGRPFRFGDLSRPTAEIDATCQINRERVDSGFFSAVDDFYAAMGSALIKLAVSGIATPLANNRWRLSIDQIGTYVRDTYDFIGDQGLGSWGPTGILRTAILAPEVPIRPADVDVNDGQAYYTVNNGSFRRYRTAFAMGGDFVIFSDVTGFCPVDPIVLEVGG